MRVLLVGGSGQLGRSLQDVKWPSNYNLLIPGRDELDITSRDTVEAYLKIHRPDAIINTAAWTDVVGAETKSKECFDVNMHGVENLVRCSADSGAVLIHISTDYVFDGNTSDPYLEEDVANPLNVYGKSKLAAEEVIQNSGKSEFYIIRTSWLYSKYGKNFVKSIAHKAYSQEQASITDDQFGSPTSAQDLAEGIASILSQKPPFGLYHFSNAGTTSWFEFGKLIYELANADPRNVSPRNSKLDPIARPKRSSFSLTKWQEANLTKIVTWEDSLRRDFPEMIIQLRRDETSA